MGICVGGEEHFFRVWVPYETTQEEEGAGETRPVLLFLHGYKECGWDNWWQCGSGLGWMLQEQEFAERFPGIVVFPQLPRKPAWETWWEAWKSATVQDALLQMIESVLRKYKGDRRRVYLLGESLGGEGVIYLAARARPGLFAAALSIAGSVEPYDWSRRAHHLVNFVRKPLGLVHIAIELSLPDGC